MLLCTNCLCDPRFKGGHLAPETGLILILEPFVCVKSPPLEFARSSILRIFIRIAVPQGCGRTVLQSIIQYCKVLKSIAKDFYGLWARQGIQKANEMKCIQIQALSPSAPDIAVHQNERLLRVCFWQVRFANLFCFVLQRSTTMHVCMHMIRFL